MMQKLLAALFADQKKQCPFSRDNRPLTDVEIEQLVAFDLQCAINDGMVMRSEYTEGIKLAA